MQHGLFSYAVEAGVIEHNPTHGLRKPKYKVRDRRLSEAEYRILGRILRDARRDDHFKIHADILRLIALTGCRRGEIVNLKWSAVIVVLIMRFRRRGCFLGGFSSVNYEISTGTLGQSLLVDCVALLLFQNSRSVRQ